MHHRYAAAATLAILSTTAIAAPHAMKARDPDKNQNSREAKGYFKHIVTSIDFPSIDSSTGNKTSHIFEHTLPWNEFEAIDIHKLAEYLYNLTIPHGSQGVKNGSEAQDSVNKESFWEKFFDVLEDNDESKTQKHHHNKNGGNSWEKAKRYDEPPKDPEEKKPIDTSTIWGKIKAKNEEWGDKYEAWEIKTLEKYLGNDQDLCKDPDYEPELRLGHDPRCPHYYKDKKDKKDKKKLGDKDNERKESVGTKSKSDEKKDGKKPGDKSPDHKEGLGDNSKGDEKKDGKESENKKQDHKESLTTKSKDDEKKDKS
jgi:hypothetical protein